MPTLTQELMLVVQVQATGASVVDGLIALAEAGTPIEIAAVLAQGSALVSLGPVSILTNSVAAVTIGIKIVEGGGIVHAGRQRRHTRINLNATTSSALQHGCNPHERRRASGGREP